MLYKRQICNITSVPTTGGRPLKNFDEQIGCKTIEKVWKETKKEAYYSSIHETIGEYTQSSKLVEIIRNPDLIQILDRRGKGSWVIDRKGERRRNYLNRIKKEFQSQADIIEIPKDLFVTESPITRYGLRWSGLYKINHDHFSKIKIILPSF